MGAVIRSSRGGPVRAARAEAVADWVAALPTAGAA